MGAKAHHSRTRQRSGLKLPSPSRWKGFADFEAYVATLPDEQHGDAFEQFVHAYLALSPEFEFTEVWRLGGRRPPRRILQRLGLPRRDVGVDFVGKRRDGALSTIQAKFRVDRSPVPWKELSTFVGASRKAKHRLLVGNQRRLAKNLPLSAREGFSSAMRSRLLTLDREFFKRWAEWERKRVVRPPKRFKPRPDQREAIRAIAKRFADGEPRTQFIAACGTGKTLTGLWLAEHLDAHRTVLFAPSLALVDQTLQAWAEQANPKTPLEAMCVCSDVTVGDALPYELSVPVTTDARALRRFWKRRLQPGLRRVVFATYQSVDVVDRAVNPDCPADLLIADEAHRIAGREGKPFQRVLDGKAIPSKHRLFMTATPRITAPHHRKRAEDEGRPIASMDDPAHFGDVACELPFGKAIGLGLLADYQIDVLGVTDDDVRKLIANRVIVDATGKRLDAETLAQAVALSKALRTGLIRYAFTFHHTKNNARTFIEALLAVTQIRKSRLYTDSIFGEMPVTERQEVLHDLLGAELGVVSSARALTEGVDAPAVDAVVFVDPKSSVVDIAQAVGRALRRDSKNPKKLAHVVVPVVIEEKDDPEAELERSAWEPVWRVLQAMRSHDQQLADELDLLQRERGKRAVTGATKGESSRLSGKVYLDLPEGVSLPRFRQAVALRVLDKATSGFQYGLGILTSYAERHGHTRVPTDCSIGGFRLGQWISVRRTEYRQGRLSLQRVAALEEFPKWTWYPHEDAFEEGLNYLRRFAERRGHTRVPPSHLENNYPLGVWVRVRRSWHRRGLLTRDRIAALEAVPGWAWDRREENFQEGFTKLQVFTKREGHSRVPQRHVEDDFPIGAWVLARRQEYAAGKLSEERRRALESLTGWTWSPQGEDFIRNLRLLRRFVNREGHSQVASTHRERGVALGKWVAHLREFYRNGRLPAERAALLAALPGWAWSPHEAAFNGGLGHLQRYARREGHAVVPQSHIENEFKLGRWVAKQRRVYRAGRMPQERIDALESVNGWSWSPSSTMEKEAFERGLSLLKQYVAREGTSRVPQGHRERGFALGVWVASRRKDYRQGKLGGPRARLLAGLPGWVWEPLDAKYKFGLESVRRYARQHGHARVPQAHQEGEFKLGQWVELRRIQYRAGRMSAERIKELEAIPGWVWDAREVKKPERVKKKRR